MLQSNTTGTGFEDKLILDLEMLKTIQSLAVVCSREELLNHIQSYIINAEECLQSYRETYFRP